MSLIGPLLLCPCCRQRPRQYVSHLHGVPQAWACLPGPRGVDAGVQAAMGILQVLREALHVSKGSATAQASPLA